MHMWLKVYPVTYAHILDSLGPHAPQRSCRGAWEHIVLKLHITEISRLFSAVYSLRAYRL